MGNTSSSIYVEQPALLRWKHIMDILNLAEGDVAQLHKAYSFIDLDSSNTISVHELISHMGVEQSSFMVRVFGLLDLDHNGGLDFGEFCVCLWNYCTLKREDLAVFAFDLYDAMQNGFLTKMDLQRILFDVYGKHMQKSKHANTLYDKIIRSTVLSYDLSSFTSFAKEHPALLYPAFMTQQRLRSSIIGNRFWNRLAKRRQHQREVISLRKLRLLVLQCKRWNDHTGRTASCVSKTKGKRGNIDSTEMCALDTERCNTHSPVNSFFERDDVTARIPLDDNKAVYYCPEVGTKRVILAGQCKKVVPLECVVDTPHRW